MALSIEDYALIGDTHTAALVGRDGSIDWLCVPHFSSPACFAALLGDRGHGRWLIAPKGDVRGTRRRYRDDSLILETEFGHDGGAVRLTDFMPIGQQQRHVVRIAEGVLGATAMHMELVIRFGYGSIVPWVQRADHTLVATAGPDTLELRTRIQTHGENLTTVADFTVHEGERIAFVLCHHDSHEAAQPPLDAEAALELTERWWHEWCGGCVYGGPWRQAVTRSLITLKALTYAPTGGIVAAPTTSLPERLGGVRNWDYRYCWLRDATFTLYALLYSGYRNEAKAWREWLLRAVAGRPEDMQILYGISGERWLIERELPWLPGYQGAAPVRVGNAAAMQYQLDVYGEVMDMLHLTLSAGVDRHAHAWEVQRVLLDFLESNWQRPDEGIWEVRGPPQQFTHSKVMAWVAFDRAVKMVERFGVEGNIERWRDLRQRIHDEVCREGYDAQRNAFVQYYGSKELDASLLLMPMMGFLPCSDPRVRGTVEAIQADLMVHGYVARYRTETRVDGLPAGEGVFLPCSFWLVDCLALLGRKAEALALFDRLLAVCNDVGLLGEEYEPRSGRMLGNFPQALTHVALINSARNLSRPTGPFDRRLQQRPAENVRSA